MQTAARINLLADAARSASMGPAKAEKPLSILSLAAVSYGARPSGDATVPTGFDPLAIALFEAIVEGAYLVANADGLFDNDEKRAFESVVVAACGGAITPQLIGALLGELGQQLREEGMDRRIGAVAEGLTKKEQAHEILRIAALLAQVTEDVSPVEHEVLIKLALRCGLKESEVEAALGHVARLLSVAPSPRSAEP